MMQHLSRDLPLQFVSVKWNAGRQDRRGMKSLFGTFAVGWLLATAVGCGNTATSSGKAGSISIANVNGVTQQIIALAVGSSVKLSMMPQGDRANAGVDWTVTCGGNPVTGSVTGGACGTLSPVHTADGGTTVYTAPSAAPIGGAIDLTATVTSHPSQGSSVSLTIVGLPIAVTMTRVPPSSLGVNANADVVVTVSNDPTDAGAYFTATCGSSACGSFSQVAPPPSTAGQSSSFSPIYTAPATVPPGGVVTIQAASLADTTKVASATLTITSAATSTPITVSVLPASVYVQTARVISLTPVVANDPAAAGVDWTISCGSSNCGSITPHTPSGTAVTYQGPSTVPTGGTVTITARSTSNPAVSAKATANILTTAPIVVTSSTAPPASITAGAQVALAAVVTGDPNGLGVNWTVSCGSVGACGSFNLSPAHTASGGQILYTAPAAVPSGAVVTITASSPATTPANPAIAVSTILTPKASISLLQTPPASMKALSQTPVSATVTNDVSPGGVNWSVSCGSTIPGGCGWVVPAQTGSGGIATYTAPPTPPGAVPGTFATITVTATSVANPGATATSTPTSISAVTTPSSVSFIPSLPSQLQPNSTVSLTAAVANDTSSAGIDWNVCGSGCGFFTVKPAIPAIPATATTPYVPPVPAVTRTSVSGWPNGLAIPYTAPTQPPTSGMVAVVASAHANQAVANSDTITILTSPTGPSLHGVVQAGSQPVVGASVSLYAAGTSGYASASSQVATATTGKDGNFTLPATYSCPAPTSQMYLTATGGSVGTNTANPNLALMTVLGSCSNLSSSPVVVNEVTTVGSAYATSPFAANDALTGNSSYLYLGTSSGNVSGLANAFAAVNNLVNISTGQANFVTPVGNAEVPYAEINTLADTLNTCAATAGGVAGDGSPCGSLFTATNVLGSVGLPGAIAPSDTLQAVFNIAQHPIANNGYALGFPTSPGPLLLATTASPFQPILSSEPNDWSLSLNYLGGGGLSTASTVGSFAVDGSGDLWITDTKAGSVIEWNAIGAALSPSAGFAAGGGPIAIDESGDVWISGNGVLTELTSLGAVAPGGPFGGVAGGGNDMTIDAQGDLWIAHGGGVSEFNNLGAELSPPGGFTYNGISGSGAVGIDSSNNAWIGYTGAAAELTNPGGQLIVSGVGLNYVTSLSQIAADNAGDVWAVGGGGACEVPPYQGKVTTLTATCWAEESDRNQSNPYLGFYNAGGVAMDGAGVAWIGSQGGGPLSFLPGLLPVVPSAISAVGLPNLLASPSLAAGPLRVAVDGAGNLWVLLTNNTVTEYVGAATPVVTPIALGVAHKKLGSKP